MTAAAGDKSIVQLRAERLQADGIQADQAHIAQRPGEFAGVLELGNIAGFHGIADVQQYPHGDARLQLEHL